MRQNDSENIRKLTERLMETNAAMKAQGLKQQGIPLSGFPDAEDDELRVKVEAQILDSGQKQ